jgi:starch-binding outer membrane protein, SusD/RagB family
MKNIKHIIVIGLLIGMVSCDLDEKILGDFTENFDPANQGVGIRNNVNKAGPNDGLGAAFSGLLGGTANHGGYFSIQEISTDEAVITQKGGDWFDGGIWLDMHKHTWGATNDGFNGTWGQTYNGIFQCNNLLANADITDPNKAQLRMLRAYYYWRLLDTFGRVKLAVTPGVDVAQSSRAAVYAFVVSELEAVKNQLPAGRPEYSRASQGAANALLSRLYLNAKVYKGLANHDPADLNLAIAAADAVINSGVYDLDPNYAKVFAPDNVENIEHIMVVAFDEATGGGMNIAQMTLHYPSQLTYRLQQQPWNGYSTLEAFYNSYADGDERKLNNFVVGEQFDTNGNPILDLAFDKNDPDGAPINYTPAINELAPNGSRQAGARLGKFSFKLGQSPDMDNDFPVLRYAEVLLNKAEALWRLNPGDAVALQLVNSIRARAKATPAFASLTEGNFLAERGRELFMESLRRTDLIRFGAWGNAWWAKNAHSNPNLNVFPIPIQQINASQEPFKLTQNPGY